MLSSFRHHISSRNWIRFIARSLNGTAAESEYDVVIVGGGMVGMGFTAMLASKPMLQNKRILLVDGGPKKRYTRNDGSVHNRVVAITPMSRQLIEDVGAWDYVEKEHYQPLTKMKVFESGSKASIILQRSDPTSPIGYIVENDLILSSLTSVVLNAVQQSGTISRPGSIDVLFETNVDKILLPTEFSEFDFPQLTVHSRVSSKSRKIKSSLLVGSDGFKSKIRSISGIPGIQWQHDQSAIIANLNLPSDFDYETAWQRFIPTGPIAFLPLGPCKSSVTWSTTRADAKRLMELDDQSFVDELNQNLSEPSHHSRGLIPAACDVVRWAVGKSTENFHPPNVLSVEPNSRACFPLSFSHATFYHGPRVALIGDAAHRLLPLSGQGVNMGFGDAASLAKHVNLALCDGADIASPRFLRAFTSDRQRSVVPMAAFVEFLQWLYSTEACPAQFNERSGLAQSMARKFVAKLGLSNTLLSIRGLGLDLADSSSLFKNFIVDAAVNGKITFFPSS